MDKVIIDKVDVSECEYYDDDTCCNKDVMSLSCENTDCIYKQLQRAKAELKKYEDMAKKGLEEFKDVGGCWGCGLQLQLNQDIEDIKQLKAENEELQARLNNITVQSNNEITAYKTECEKLKEENKILKSANAMINKSSMRDYQCLKEIKEIAENLKSPHCTECSQVFNKKGKCTGDCGNDYRKQILDKISEVME